MGLAPVLRTLTAATSSDSIWALSACQFLLNTLLADYSCMKPGSRSKERCRIEFSDCHIKPVLTANRLTSVLSMNAAMSSSVVLASRLPDDLSVFSLVLFAVQLFALFPILRHRFWVGPLPVHVAFLNRKFNYSRPFRHQCKLRSQFQSLHSRSFSSRPFQNPLRP